jgi:Cupin
VLRFEIRQGSAGAWTKSSLEFATDEIAARRAGSETILAKLSELLFVESLRRYVEGLPEEQTGGSRTSRTRSYLAPYRYLTGVWRRNGRSTIWATIWDARSAFPARRWRIASRA